MLACVCMCEYMYVCVSGHGCVCGRVSVCVDMHVCVCTCTRVCRAHVHMCVCPYACVCDHVCTGACVCLFKLHVYRCQHYAFFSEMGINLTMENAEIAMIPASCSLI